MKFVAHRGALRFMAAFDALHFSSFVIFLAQRDGRTATTQMYLSCVFLSVFSLSESKQRATMKRRVVDACSSFGLCVHSLFPDRTEQVCHCWAASAAESEAQSLHKGRGERRCSRRSGPSAIAFLECSSDVRTYSNATTGNVPTI